MLFLFHKEPAGLPGGTHLHEQLTLTVVELLGKPDIVGDDKVAIGAVATVVTLATQTDLGTILRTGLNLEFHFLTAAELDDYLTTEQSGVEVYVHFSLHLPRTLPSSAKAVAAEAP